jgi:hypothetical protein
MAQIVEYDSKKDAGKSGAQMEPQEVELRVGRTVTLKAGPDDKGVIAVQRFEQHPPEENEFESMDDLLEYVKDCTEHLFESGEKEE